VSELITDEIVEAAARAMWNAQTLQPWQMLDDGDEWPSWVDLATRDRLRAKARSALEAAAALIAALALSQAATWFRQQGYERDETAALALDAMRMKLGTHGTMKEG
jgi:hypothetical protein